MQYFIYYEVLFPENVRTFPFKSLPIGDGKSANQKEAPSDDQLNLMDELMEQMDLTKLET